MGTPWDARTYDLTSEPQQAWASDVLARVDGIAPDATVLDVGCGSGRVTEALPALVPQGRVLALDASADMVALARTRLGERAAVWCQDVLDLDLDREVDAIRVREVIEAVARDAAPELVGWSPWVFAGPEETEARLQHAGFTAIRCWLQDRPTHPDDVDAFVRTSILPAHLARLPAERRERFAAAVTARVRPPLDYVRLNVSAVRFSTARMPE